MHEKLMRAPAAVGTMYFGTKVPQTTALRILDEAFDRGMRNWDTANNYAFWVPGGTGDESELSLGRWFATNPSRRDDVFLATKVGARPRPGGTTLTDAQGLSPTAIRTQLHESLHRLRTDRVDLLYAHIDDASVPLVDVLGTLEMLREEGLVGEIGASNLTTARLSDAVGAASALSRRGYEYLQQRFTFLSPAAGTDLAPHILLDDAITELCTSCDITMLGYAPLLSGAYTRSDRPLPAGYDTATNQRALATLARVAERAGLDSGQAVLAWMSQRDATVLPVVGVSSVEHLRAAATAVTTVLTPADIAELEAARMGG